MSFFSRLFPSATPNFVPFFAYFARFYAIGLYDGIHCGGSAFSAVQAAFCWAMGSMRPAARVVRSEQMSCLEIGNCWGRYTTNLIFYFKSFLCLFCKLSKTHVDLMETPICRPHAAQLWASHRSLVVSFLCFIFLRKVTEVWMFAVVGRVAYSRDTIQVNTYRNHTRHR